MRQTSAVSASNQAPPYEDILGFVDWWVQADPIYMKTVLDAIKEFAGYVDAEEPGTLIYLVYTPRVPSQPPAGTGLIVFVESYASEADFNLHLGHFDSHIRNRFGGLFVAAPNAALQPFIQVENAARYRPAPNQPPAGFIRPGGAHKAAITQIVKWWLTPQADRTTVLLDLAKFAAFCREEEPGTLLYLFSLPVPGSAWPPAGEGEIVFMAAYESEAARTLHIDNWDRLFLAPHKDDFISSPGGSFPFIQVLDLELFAGMVRPAATTGGGAAG